MDWNAAIERNRETLKRLVASLLAMAGMGSRGQFTFFPQESVRPQDVALAEKSKLSPAPTLPRHLHRAVLRLLRPAEAAARRLVIVAAREVVLPAPAPPCPRKPKPKSVILRNGVGTGVILPRNLPHPEVRGDPEPRACRGVEGPQRTLCLPLTDRLNLPRLRRPSISGVPRISVPGFGAPFPVAVRRLASPSDPINATRLAIRLSALAAALDDLPAHARRFARWRSRRRHGHVLRISPLRPGRPPGQRPARCRRPAHEVHEALGDLHYFAVEALQRPDTS